MRQHRRDVLFLFSLTIAVRLIVASLMDEPGYMDVAYYTTGALQLARGEGFTEPFIWNYLDRPAGLPHPGFLYWMPLPSILAAPFAILFPGSFFALQLPFALLSALLPPLTYWMAWRTSSQRIVAWLAGLLVLFSGLFFPYWTLPETFTPVALSGSLALWLAGTGGSRNKRRNPSFLLAGGLVGLAHLTRADGILLLPVIALAAFISPAEHRGSPSPGESPNALQFTPSRSSLVLLSLMLIGYLVVMAPWFVRNLAVTGSPLSPAGTQTLWLRDYNDIFCYHCDLSPSSYLAWGWSNILNSKWWAAKINLQRFLAENCLVFLLPFTLFGLYRLRRRLPFLLSTVYLFLLFLAHSFAFTFPGPRGGFFHASIATLPFLHTAAAEALHVTIRWAGRKRRWNLRQSQVVFTIAVVLLATILSAYALVGKLSVWRDELAAYADVEAHIEQEVPQGVRMMVGNPPALWYVTRRPAVMVPNEGLETVLEVSDRYDVGYLLLDRNHPPPLEDVYEGRIDSPRLSRIPLPSSDLMLWRIEP